MGPFKINKDPSNYEKKPIAKTEKKEKQGKKVKQDNIKLQTDLDVGSDPSFNSHDGYETRYMNPSDEKDIVKYNTENSMDPDIVATQAHIKQ